MTQTPTDSIESTDDPDRGPAEADQSAEPMAPPVEASAAGTSATDDQPGGADGDAGGTAPDGTAAAEGTPRKSAAKRLEEEGEIAADYLEELLDITDLDGDIDIDVENGRAAVSVVAAEDDAVSVRALNRLVGRDGEVLEALQELTRLAVQTRTGERTRLMLDVAGFRAGRRVELEKTALEAVESVRTSGEPMSLTPMSPFERKVVHDAVAGAGLRSESEGEGTARRVVVLPAEG